VAQGLIVSWAGMRGLLTLATAFALPNDFPQRDVVVLIAFSVVLATLVFQGLTLTPLIKLLKLDALEDPARQLTKARAAIAKTGRDALAGTEGREAQNAPDRDARRPPYWGRDLPDPRGGTRLARDHAAAGRGKADRGGVKATHGAGDWSLEAPVRAEPVEAREPRHVLRQAQDERCLEILKR
jgi:NhaP-type Na+/H+ or K+/H+ antiporter